MKQTFACSRSAVKWFIRFVQPFVWLERLGGIVQPHPLNTLVPILMSHCRGLASRRRHAPSDREVNSAASRAVLGRPGGCGAASHRQRGCQCSGDEGMPKAGRMCPPLKLAAAHDGPIGSLRENLGGCARSAPPLVNSPTQSFPCPHTSSKSDTSFLPSGHTGQKAQEHEVTIHNGVSTDRGMLLRQS